MDEIELIDILPHRLDISKSHSYGRDSAMWFAPKGTRQVHSLSFSGWLRWLRWTNLSKVQIILSEYPNATVLLETLESRGTLGKLKAQVRAEIFHTLEDKVCLSPSAHPCRRNPNPN